MSLGLSPLSNQLSSVLFSKALPFCIFLLECHTMEGIMSILQMRVVRPRSQTLNLENQILILPTWNNHAWKPGATLLEHGPHFSLERRWLCSFKQSIGQQSQSGVS